MKKILRITIVLFAIIVSVTHQAYAETIKFTGKGSAVIISQDVLGATKLAYTAAQKKAISRAMESMVRKGTKEAINYNRKKSQLLQPPFPFLKKERVISNTVKNGLLTLEIEVTVSEKELSKLLEQKGVLVLKSEKRKKADFPSVMVLVVEEVSGKINSFPFSSRVIMQELIKKKFEVVDETIIKKSIKHDQAVQGVLRGDSKAAMTAALQFEAGILITGRAIVKKGGMKSGGMQLYSANVSLTAIQADSGRVIASSSAEGSYPHIDSITGLKKAVEGAARKAIIQVIKDMEKGFEFSDETVLASISGISFPQLAVLKKILKRDFKSISSIKQKSYANNVAKFNLRIDCKPEELAERIVLKDFKSFKLDVLSFSPRKIDFILKMKKKR